MWMDLREDIMFVGVQGPRRKDRQPSGRVERFWDLRVSREERDQASGICAGALIGFWRLWRTREKGGAPWKARDIERNRKVKRRTSQKILVIYLHRIMVPYVYFGGVGF